MKAVLEAIPKCVTTPGDTWGQGHTVRYAEPGEFTRRAFYNDRLDLTQIEALGNTLSADTEQQRRLAVRGTTNALAKQYDSWRKQLLYARAELEALIDFAEDQQFDESPAELVSAVVQQVKLLRSQVQAYIVNSSRGELVRNGIKIALLGAPNAGKSSLLNRIVGREAVIVSKEEGTTRDIVEVGVDIGGFYCKFGDMAGLRSEPISHRTQSGSEGDARGATIGEVEKEGIRRAKARALDSDLVIVVLAVEHEATNTEGSLVNVDREVAETAVRCAQDGKAVVYLINKMDLLRSSESPIKPRQLHGHISKLRKGLAERLESIMPNSMVPHNRIFAISCEAQTTTLDQDPGGIQSLLRGMITIFEEITAPLDAGTGDLSSDPAIGGQSLGATERQRLLMIDCLGHLDAFLPHEKAELEDDYDVVVGAENLRAAANCLGRITGRGEAGDVEEVLGVVFEK